jgi:anti-anti-sigma factor
MSFPPEVAVMDTDSAPKDLQLSSEETPSASILHARGEVDLLSGPVLREHLMRLIIEGRGVPVIADFSGLRYLDRKGVRVLEDCYRRAELQGSRLILVGSIPLVHQILTIVKLDQRIPVVATMGEALKVLEKSE